MLDTSCGSALNCRTYMVVFTALGMALSTIRTFWSKGDPGEVSEQEENYCRSIAMRINSNRISNKVINT
jgi:hypothetical protein